jgi:hypothetical protein
MAFHGAIVSAARELFTAPRDPPPNWEQKIGRIPPIRPINRFRVFVGAGYIRSGALMPMRFSAFFSVCSAARQMIRRAAMVSGFSALSTGQSW